MPPNPNRTSRIKCRLEQRQRHITDPLEAACPVDVARLVDLTADAGDRRHVDDHAVTDCLPYIEEHDNVFPYPRRGVEGNALQPHI